MPKHGKKYRGVEPLVEPGRLYGPREAIDLLKMISYTTFDGTVELHLRLGIDPRQADQIVRGTAVLPHGTGRVVRVAVFAQGDKAREAEEAGADVVGAQDLVQRVEGGFLDFDVAVATPDLMGQVGRLGRPASCRTRSRGRSPWTSPAPFATSRPVASSSATRTARP